MVQSDRPGHPPERIAYYIILSALDLKALAVHDRRDAERWASSTADLQ